MNENWNTKKELQAYKTAVDNQSDSWVAAAGGTEVPTTARSGRTYLYCFNPKQSKHGWLDLGTDIIQFDSPYEL